MNRFAIGFLQTLRSRCALLMRLLAGSVLLMQAFVAAAQPVMLLDTRVQDDFVVDDRVISDPTQSMVDMEFNQREGLLAWQDESNNLWVATVDPFTGEFIPRSGKGALVATGLVSIEQTLNGPEWLETEDGMEIVFSLQGRTPRIGHAWRVGPDWTYESVSKSRKRYNPYGSKDPNDPAPRILYVFDDTFRGRHTYWRELDDPTTERKISERSLIFPSWIDGARAILTTFQFDGVEQCAWYDIDTDERIQISTGSENKKFGRAWRAPEYEDAWVAVCANSAGSKLGIYLRTGSTWDHIGTVLPPSGDAMYSVEYFVYGGKSYIFMVTTVAKKYTDVWVFGIDFGNPFQRRVNAAIEMDRRDPEVFITTQGPFIYYMEKTGRARGVIHRAATGLGPLQ